MTDATRMKIQILHVRTFKGRQLLICEKFMAAILPIEFIGSFSAASTPIVSDECNSSQEKLHTHNHNLSVQD